MALHVAIAGASGRMGKMLVEAITGDPTFRLVGALEAHGSAALGEDAAAFLGHETGVPITDDLDHALAQAQVFIDFTRPDATMRHLDACVRRAVAMVIGTTGFSAEGKNAIAQAAQKIGIVFAPNMSVGINVTLKLLEVAAKALSDNYDIEIIETHHRHKVDAPSGTALQMGEVIAHVLGRDIDHAAVFDRHGETGERQSGSIGFSSIRGGDIVGDHTVLFAGTGERIEITHRAASRMTYASGSLRAAKFILARAPGLYSMQQVLGLEQP